MIDRQEYWIKRGIKIGVAVIVVLFIYFTGWYQVPEGYRGVYTRFGKIVGVEMPGAGLKWPLVDDVAAMTVQTWKYDISKVNTYSKDTQQFDAVLSINLNLLPDSAEAMYRQFGVRWWESTIQNNLLQTFKEVAGTYSAPEIVAGRERLAQASLLKLQDILRPSGINVTGLQIQNVQFKREYEHAVEQVAQAQANVIQAQQELAKVRVSTEQQVAQATAAATATRLTADANAYAVKINGDAEAAAIKAKTEALKASPDVINLTAAQKWDGKLPATMVPGAAVPFIGVK